MMRSWVVRNARTIIVASATVSIVAHTALITGWVLGTLPHPGSGLPDGSIANRVFYIPPPDRVPGRVGVREVIHYIRVDQGGSGLGEGVRSPGNQAPTTLDETASRELPVPKDTAVSESLTEVASDNS